MTCTIKCKTWHILSNVNHDIYYQIYTSDRVMVFIATFNNILAISWWSVLLVEKPGENNWPAASHTDKLYHIMLYWVRFAWAGFKLITLVVIGTDSIGSYKSNYHTITTSAAPILLINLLHELHVITLQKIYISLY
jgi:hypothetical protein